MQLFFSEKFLLETQVFDSKGTPIGKLSYPQFITTKMMRGTDTGKSGIYVGKKIIDGVTIQIQDQQPCTIVREYLTAHDFITSKNNYNTSVKQGDNIIFTCQQTYVSWTRQPEINFVYNETHFTVINQPFRSRTWDIFSKNVLCGTFSVHKNFTTLLSIKYDGDDSLTQEIIIYLYAILFRPSNGHNIY